MGTALASTNWNLGRELWPQNDIYELVLKESPLLGRIKKDTKFGEDVRHIAIGSGLPQGVGPGFEDAKDAKSPSLADQVAIRAKTYYALFSIQGRLMRQAKIDKAVIVKPYARESRNAVLQWKRDISAFMYGNGGGAIGKIDSTTVLSSQVLKLADTSKIRFFSRKMRLQFSATDGTTGTVRTGYVTIAKINKSGPNKGQITIAESSLQAAITGIQTGDFIFRKGVFGNVINGLAAWIPPQDPGTGSIPGTFLGLDRTTDPEAYAGIRIDGTKLGVFEAGMVAASAIVDATGSPDLWVMSTTEWNNLRIELSGAGSLTFTAVPASGIGKYKPGLTYQAIEIVGPAGPIKVLADPDCPTGRSYMLQSDTWTLASTGELVSLIEGPMMEEMADAWENRFVGDLEMYTEAPGYNATIQHNAAA